MARVRGLENPVEGFDWKKLEQGHEARQHRFDKPQLLALLRVRYQVDPRFALFLAFSAQSITRSAEIRNLMRSHVDRSLSIPPTRHEAPYGYEDPITGLWRTGYLRELERRWTAKGTDYPLFGGRRLKAGIMPPDRPSAQKPIANLRPREWLQKAEKLAGIEHVEWRSWHGVRRAISDLLEEGTDLATLTAMGRWKNQATPERIYLDRKKYGKLAKGRRALEDLF